MNLILGVIPSLVACTAGPGPAEPPAVVIPPVDAPAPPPAAPSADLVTPPGSIALLTWLDSPAGCGVDLTIVGGPSTPIGVIPGACPEQGWRDTSAIRTADGRLLLKTPSGALERSKDGVVTVLPPLSASWSLDDVGYDAAGGIVAGGRWTATESEVMPAGETMRHTWTIDGAPVVYLAKSGDADAAVCGWFPWVGGAWGKPVLEPMGLTEGTNTPYCMVSAVGAPAPLPRPSDGGPGVSLPTAPVPGGREGDWHVEGVFAMGASEWLEGQNRVGPLYFAAALPWTPVVGMDATGVLALDLHERWMIACRTNHAVVVDVANGAVRWSGAVCPTAWPPG